MIIFSDLGHWSSDIWNFICRPEHFIFLKKDTLFQACWEEDSESGPGNDATGGNSRRRDNG